MHHHWGEKKFVSGIKYTRVSPDGDEGFKGKLHVEAYYCISNESELYIKHKAWLDESNPEGTVTPCNLTCHVAWNISGDMAEPTIRDHGI